MNISLALTCVLLALIHCGCENATKEELRAIHELNEESKDFEFAPGPGPVGIYLEVKIAKASWDSLELKNVYDSSVGKFKRQSGISWAYLLVHDRYDKYLFTISKDEAKDSHVFFVE